MTNSIDSIFLKTNESGKITHVSIYFPQILDSSFYEEMILEYGQPTKILKYGKSTSSSESKTELGYGSSKKFEMNETTIDDNPIFIIWSENAFNTFITNNNITKIEFSLDN